MDSKKICHEKSSPGSLDGSALGHVSSGETSVSFIEIFELQVSDDFTIAYNTEDFSAYFWLKPKEIVQKFQNSEKIRKTLISIMKALYGV